MRANAFVYVCRERWIVCVYREVSVAQHVDPQAVIVDEAQLKCRFDRLFWRIGGKPLLCRNVLKHFASNCVDAHHRARATQKRKCDAA